MPLRLPPSVELAPVVAENAEFDEGSTIDLEERGTLILDTILKALWLQKCYRGKEFELIPAKRGRHACSIIDYRGRIYYNAIICYQGGGTPLYRVLRPFFVHAVD